MEMVDSGHLSFDDKQLDLLKKLDEITKGITSNSKSWFSSKTTKGLYKRADVGRGTTQIKDIFFVNLDIKNKKMTIFDAATLYKNDKTPMIVIAGKEYGSGSSRDWAAKGTMLLGIQAVIVESFERIHRSNLIGMGVLPLQFLAGQSAKSLNITGKEKFDILDINQGRSNTAKVIASNDNGKEIEFEAKIRIDPLKNKNITLMVEFFIMC